MNYFRAGISESTFTTIFGPVKKLIAIAFILLLSAQCVFKLSIIAYFEANRHYIAEVLCVNKGTKITTCYGQCFLDRNLSVADEKSSEQIPTNSKFQFDTQNFIGNTFTIELTRHALPIVDVSPPQPIYSLSLPNFFFIHPAKLSALIF